ncbi:MAG: hypothetical protein ABI946_08435 [Chthoniobacterales bacterium]
MKPTFQLSRQSRSSGAARPTQISQRPITDWSFQTSAPEMRCGSTLQPSSQHSALEPAFHTLSQGFFSGEANRESRFEGALFGVMTALAAWPIALAVQAAAILLK